MSSNVDEYGGLRWRTRFAVANPTARIVGRVRNLIVVRFSDGMLCKVVGGSPETPTCVELDANDRAELRSSVEAGAAGDATDPAGGFISPSAQAPPMSPLKRVAIGTAGVAAWSGLAAVGAGLAPKHPGTGAAISTGLGTIAAEVSWLALFPPGPGNPAYLMALPAVMGATILGASVAGTKIAKKHKTAGAAIGAGIAATLWTVGVAIAAAYAKPSSPAAG